MADRYWVGGSGNWNATSTTNWATSSGGASGASAPTSADNVIFDANSNTLLLPFTVTVTGTSAAPALCNDFSTSSLDGAMTLTMGATAFLDVYGSMTLPATNFSVSGTAGAGIRYKSTTTGKTLTTNGVSLGNVAITFDGVGGGWTLGSAYTSTQALNINNGTFNTDSTSNYSVTCSQLAFANASNTRQIDLNASTITLTVNNTGALSIPNVNNLTFNAGTSTIVLSGPNSGIAVIDTSSITFYNVEFTSTGGGGSLLSGINTYNNLSMASLASTGVRSVQINSSFTVSGTLTLGTANTAIRRIFMRSSTVGTPRTITAATVATLADVDFRDIVGAGLGTWSGTRLGNCGGNSGITLDAAKTVYRVGTGNWSATQWSLSSGGSVDVNNFPLAQDTAIFDTGTTTGTHTIDAAWNIGNLDMSALNVAVTLATGTTTPNIHGNLTLDADVTLTGTGAISFSGVSNQTITSAGKTFTQALTVNKPTTTSLILGDALTTNLAFTLTQGTLDLNNFNLTCLTFASGGTNTRAIAFGTSKIVITGNGGTILGMNNATNFTYTGTSRIESSYSGSSGTRTFQFGTDGGATESNALNVYILAGSDTVQLTNFGNIDNYRTVDFTGFSGTYVNRQIRFYGNLIFSSGMTLNSGTSNIFFAATSGTQQITTNGKTLDFPITKQGAGTLQLLDNLTIGSTRTLTYTAGTLDLNNQTLSMGLFSSSNSNTRAIAFGTGQINVTGNNALIFTMVPTTNFSCTGTKNIEFNYSGSTGDRTFAFQPTATPESNLLNFIVKPAGDNVYVNRNQAQFFGANNITIESGFTGNFGVSLADAVTLSIYGNLSIPSTLNGFGPTTGISFPSASNVQTLTTSGKTMDFAVTKSGAGTLQLLDNLTIGSTRTLTHTAGTLDANDFTLTTGLYSSTGSTARQLDVGTGTLAVTGATFTASGSNYTTAGSGKVSMTSASSKTFAGGGFTYPILNQGGAGNLIITGANTFTGITNTVQPATIIFPSSTTQNITNFNVSGTSGNLITIESSTSGTQATLNSPSNITNLVSYVSLKDNRGQGGIWQAPSNYNNTILTNVTGWFTGILHADTVVEPCVSNESLLPSTFYGVNLSEGIASNDVNVSQVIYNGNVLEDSTIADIISTTIVASAYANVIGIASVSAYPNANWSAKGSIVGLANVIVDGAPIGYEWTEVPPSSDIWLRQG